MHIGLVVYDGLDGRSGGYRYDRQLVSYLRDLGDEVEVISLSRRGTLGTATDTISPAIRRDLDRPVDILLQDALCADVLWRHNTHLTRPGAVLAIVHLLRSAKGMGNRRLPWRWLERRYLRTLDGAVCPSASTVQETRALTSIPTTVAYPAGRHEGMATHPATVRSHAASGPLDIVFVGNVIPRKGVMTLLDALEGLSGEWRATIVGSHDADPSYARTVRRTVDRHEAAARIEVVGAVSDDRLETVLTEAHVLAIPSRRESFGMVYLEAMEYGTVPIATTVGGSREFVVDGYNGRLVPPDDPVALQGILHELLTDRDELAALGARALETAEYHTTWAASMSRVRQFLRSRIDDDVAEPPAVTIPSDRMPATAKGETLCDHVSTAQQHDLGGNRR